MASAARTMLMACMEKPSPPYSLDLNHVGTTSSQSHDVVVSKLIEEDCKTTGGSPAEGMQLQWSSQGGKLFFIELCCRFVFDRIKLKLAC